MDHQKSRILAHLRLPTFLSAATSPRFWVGGGLALLTLSGAVIAFGTSTSTLTSSVARRDIVEELRPDNLIALSNSATNTEQFIREERVRPGDSAQSLLKRIGVNEEETLALLRQTPEASAFFRQISPGKIVTAEVSKNQDLQSLMFPLNGQSDRAIIIKRNGQGFTASETALPVETQTVLKSAEIRYSLFGATDTAGIPDAIATQLADIFGGDIDFHRDLRKGDRFSVIYETVSYQGKLLRTGRILATEFINDGKRYRALWFGDASGKGGYYTPDGKNLRKAFLRSPLEFSRVTSGFSSARFHPVLQTWRAHKGVDYGAPIGTRVRATADGTVEFVGTQGGYGKVVVLKHQGRYSTVYGHLSNFAAGLKPGKNVTQGGIIAYTGMTGLASGPHLHYEFRIDGIHQNPLTVALPGSPPLAPQQLSYFKSLAASQMERIDMIHSGNMAALD